MRTPTTLRVQNLDAAHTASTSVLLQEFGEQRPVRCVFLSQEMGRGGPAVPAGAALLDFATGEDTVAAFTRARKLGMDARFLSDAERAEELAYQQRLATPQTHPQQQQQQQYNSVPMPMPMQQQQQMVVQDEDVEDVVRSGTLTTRTVVVVEFQLCWDERFARDGMCAPVEIGALCFTAAGGFVAAFQRIVSPGRVPAAVSDSAWWHTAHRHGIPADYPDAEKRYGQLWADLGAFLRHAAARTPVDPRTARPYAPLLVAKHPRTANRCLEWMRRTAGVPAADAAARVPLVRSADALYAALQPGGGSGSGLAALVDAPVTRDHMCRYPSSLNDPAVPPPPIVEPLTSNAGARRPRIAYRCAEADAHLLFRAIMDLVTPPTITVSGVPSSAPRR